MVLPGNRPLGSLGCRARGCFGGGGVEVEVRWRRGGGEVEEEEEEVVFTRENRGGTAQHNGGGVSEGAWLVCRFCFVVFTRFARGCSGKITDGQGRGCE